MTRPPINVRPRRSAALLALLATAAACAEEGPSGDATARRDSAGIAILENHRSAWDEDGDHWRVDSVPELRIGVQEGEPAYQFFRLRDAMRLDDGRIVASNAGSSELRFFEGDGRFQAAVGGPGSGPGEFGEFSSLRMCRDGEHILVQDAANDRVNVFSLSGEYVSTYRLQPAGGGRPAVVIGCAGGGRLLGISYTEGSTLSGDPGDLIALEAEYVVLGGAGAVASTVARVSLRLRYVNEAEGGIHYPFVPFVPEPMIAGGPEAAYVAVTGAASVERRSFDGDLLGIIRWQGPERRRVEEIWDRYVRESLASIPDEERRLRYRRFYQQDLPVPEFAPALQALEVDELGNLWVERYRLSWETESVWDVIDGEGRWLGAVAVPSSLEVFRVGSDHVIGREVDDLGIERLVVYRIVKP